MKLCHLSRPPSSSSTAACSPLHPIIQPRPAASQPFCVVRNSTESMIAGATKEQAKMLLNISRIIRSESLALPNPPILKVPRSCRFHVVFLEKERSCRFQYFFLEESSGRLIRWNGQRLHLRASPHRPPRPRRRRLGSRRALRRRYAACNVPPPFPPTCRLKGALSPDSGPSRGLPG